MYLQMLFHNAEQTETLTFLKVFFKNLQGCLLINLYNTPFVY